MAREWWTLAAVVAGMFMLLLDVTIVNVALPQIQNAFGASLPDLQWVIEGYALTLAALLLTGGALADRFGRRVTFAAGTAIFTVGSLLCGLATGPLDLALSRAGQGIGGAQSGLTTAARHAVVAAARAGFTGSLNTILLIGAAIAAIAATTPLTLIRGRDFAPAPADTETHADSSQLTAAAPVTS